MHIENRKNIAIIPARKGSKGLPGKNIKIFHGKPLIYWTIKIAIASKVFDEVIVSTDCVEIAEISRNCGANVPFIRPNFLSTDTSSSVDVVLHALDFYRDKLKLDFKFLTLLEPTSPLRERKDLVEMNAFIERQSNNFDAIISLGELSESPSLLKRLDKTMEVQPFSKKFWSEGRRQEQETAYFPYGVAYICKTSTFLKELSFYPQRTAGYLIQSYQCNEIDSEIDFICAEAIAKSFGLKI